ncbi:3895_t:CDS:10 [Racocetra fulgida]|uniref:3895_t:CDS:1 n=1 Tax=Racocetra fulgida TaxID=60492 RepID=A0A9N8VQ38_9GLOM|nr:3895_t:CDS:10 [Racocetra fulgida]
MAAEKKIETEEVVNSKPGVTGDELNQKSLKKPHVKNKRRKKKKNDSQVIGVTSEDKSVSNNNENGKSQEADDSENVEIEYVLQPLDVTNDPYYEEFSKVFAHFQITKDETEVKSEIKEEKNEALKTQNESRMKDSDDDTENESEDEERQDKVSKKKLKKMNRLSVAQLKQLVKRPEVVEWVDVTAADPKLLVSLKAYRNTVPVPQHWSQKRKYLQGKRGIEKPAFDLPDFIKDTGIMEMREAVKEKEDAAKLKQKTRERVQPKMGKLDIDYQKLHDAFFRFQSKPKLTIHGELYYEGKEFETKLKEKKPGQLSEELKAALNMPPLAPPPWLIAMQRYGPPPSYPNLKIPGLNAPIPEGAQWGFHPGGWGKPPVDEYNRPLYGDVFGTYQQEIPSDPIERSLWGELEAEEGALQEGLATPSGISSVPSGLETPEYIELRKYQASTATQQSSILPSGLETPDIIELRKYSKYDSSFINTKLEFSNEPKPLYTVLPQKDTSISGFMGSQHAYDLSAASTTGGVKGAKRKVVGTGIDVALDPSEMANLDEETLRAIFEEAQQANQPEGSREDFSDLVAEHASKQAKKRQKLADAKAAARDAVRAQFSELGQHQDPLKLHSNRKAIHS